MQTMMECREEKSPALGGPWDCGVLCLRLHPLPQVGLYDDPRSLLRRARDPVIWQMLEKGSEE